MKTSIWQIHWFDQNIPYGLISMAIFADHVSQGDYRALFETQPFNWSNQSTFLRVVQLTKYSWLSLSRPHLSRITAYLEVKILSLPKHENVTTSNKYCGKEEKLLLRSNFSSFPQYFRYISKFKSPITYQFVKCGCSNYFSSILKIWYVEVRISQNVSESPMEFEITRVDCNPCWLIVFGFNNMSTLGGSFYVVSQRMGEKR